jgi:DNA-directed RNA polymerase specialized sigma subunit
MPRKSTHYLNNRDFLKAIREHREKVQAAKESGQVPPRIPEYIGECIYKIANHVAFRPNFINYPFRDDMVGDGIENAIKAVNNFNPDMSSNPFGYFTRIIWRAFIRKIQKEKHELKIKSKMLEQSGFDEVFSMDGDYGFSMSDMNTIKENLEIKNSRYYD